MAPVPLGQQLRLRRVARRVIRRIGLIAAFAIAACCVSAPAALAFGQVTGSPFGPTGSEPLSVAFSPGGGLLATANFNSNSVSVFSVGAGGALTQVTGSPFTTGSFPESVAFSPGGGLLATANGSGNSVSVFSVGAGGALTQVTGSPFTTGSGPYSVAFSPGGGLLATANGSGNSVSVFSVGAGGALTQVTGSPFTTGSEPHSVAFSPGGGLLATGNINSGNVSVFSVAAGGALTQVTGSPFATGSGEPYSVAFSPGGGLLATANEFTNSSLSVFSVGASGALTQVAGSPFTTGGSESVAFSPGGGLLVTANDGNNDVSVFSVGAGGALTQVTGSPFTTGSAPLSVAFSPGGGLLATANLNSKDVSVFSTAVSAPSASIGSPAGGGTYSVGQVVPTSFSCAEASGGPGLSSCLDSNGSTSPGALNTLTVGPHTYTVTATSEDGQTGTASISYTVVGTLYAAVGGSGTLCTSGSPCTLTEALSSATNSDTVDLAAGTYQPASGSSFTISTSITMQPTTPGSSVILKGNNAAVLVVDSSVTTTISGVTIEDGYASTFFGGGIINDGTATVEDSTITDNTANTPEGNSAAGSGGGIYNVGQLTVEGSTISDNTALDVGGGILNSRPGTATVADSTFWDNTAGVGGGIANESTATVEASTISDNGGIAIWSPGPGACFGCGAATLAANIIAKQSAGGDCLSGGAYTDAGYNVDDDGSCGLSSSTHSVSGSTVIDDYLGTFGSNGGSAETVPLLAVPSPMTGSADPALRVIPATFDLPVAVNGVSLACSVPDQRGDARAQPCDIGAFELPGATVTFNPNGGSGTIAPESAAAPMALTANSFTRVGYTFSGWDTAADGSGTAYADGATYGFIASATLYAQWTEVGPPSASISSPASGGTYNLNQVVSTSFSCSDAAGGPGIQSCTDSNGSSSPGALNTSTTGSHTYTVTATSNDGQTGTASISYTVAGPPAAQISSPADDQTFDLGAIVPTAFFCSEAAGGPGIASCTDSSGSSSPGALDTSTTGTLSYTVTATSQDGQTGTAAIHYTVVGPPSASISAPGDNQTFDLNQSVPTSFRCSPATGGPSITSCTDSNGSSSPGALDTTTTGPHTYTVTGVAADGQIGMASIHYTVAGPPTATIHSPADNETYNFNQTVPTSFSCSDDPAGPGVEACTDNNGSTSPGALDTTTAGPHIYTVTAVSQDGQIGTATIHYTVVGPPSATISSPADNQTFDLGASAPTAFSCSEATGGPGIAACTDSNGATSPGALNTSTAGPHTYTITAVSEDGQTGTATIHFTVVGPPSATITSPADNQTFGLNQSVPTSFSCSPATGGPGISSCTDSNGSNSPGALDTSAAGLHTYTVTAVAADGQIGTATLHYTVAGPPSATINSPADSQTYNQGQTVHTSFTCTDDPAGPGIQICTDSNGSTSPGELDTSTTGPHTYTVTATSKDGQIGTATIHYTVVGPPTATINSPADSQTYTQNQSVPTNFSCADASGGPGIQSCTDSIGSTSPGALDTSTTGPHTYTVTATSKDGQTGTATIHYTVNAPVCSVAPSIATQPSNETVTAPATAMFTAAGSTPPNCSAPTVQWSSEAPGATSFTPIPGASAPSYTTPPTATAQSGTKYEATFTNAFGSTTTNPATLTVNAAGSAPAIDAQQTATGTTSATATVTTPTAGDLIVAFVAGDGPSTGGQTATVSGGGLTWTLAGRTTAQFGTSEIWSARATGTLTSAAIKATLSKTKYMVSLTVVAFSGSSGIGATKSVSAATGAPTATLTTTQANSWVFAVGDDWDRAVNRTPGPNQTIVSQSTDPAGDTYWAQSTTTPTPAAGTPVTINDTAPTNDRWNLQLAEILGGAGGAVCSVAPSIATQPSNETVTAPATAMFTAAGSTPPNCSAPTVQWSSEAPGATSFTPIPGASAPSYTTPPTATAQSGTKYEATFTNAFGSTTTNPATLTVNAPVCSVAPSIATQPSNETVTAPATAMFTAAGSTPPNCSAPTVQWSSEAPGATSFTPIPGASAPSYTTPPTATAQSGTKYEATFTNAFGSTTTNPATLTVNAAGSAPAIDAQQTATGTTSATATVTTPTAGDLIVAFVAGDGPSTGGQTATVSGGGLTWTLAGRTTAQFGTSEIWSARATGTLTSAAIKATLSKTKYMVSLTVVAFSGSSGIGATKSVSAATGAPTATLTTTQANSWVFAVGDDWDRAVNRTPGPNQTIVSQSTDPAGDTYWAQSTTTPTPAAGTPVTINDTAPTNDRWNLQLAEIL